MAIFKPSFQVLLVSIHVSIEPEASMEPEYILVKAFLVPIHEKYWSRMFPFSLLKFLVNLCCVNIEKTVLVGSYVN